MGTRRRSSTPAGAAAKAARRSGRRLERIVASIERLVGEGVTVRERFKVHDHVSDTQREFDVVCTTSDAAAPISFAIECKDHAKPLDQPVIEAFVTKCRDTGVSERAIVSGSGFTEGAAKKAEYYGVLLFELVGGERLGWPSWFLARELRGVNTTWSIEAALAIDTSGAPLPNFRVGVSDKVFRFGGELRSLMDVASHWMTSEAHGRGLATAPGESAIVPAIVDFAEPPALTVAVSGQYYFLREVRFQIKIATRELPPTPLVPHAVRRLDGTTRGFSMVSMPVEIGGKRVAFALSAVQIPDGGYRVNATMIDGG